MDTPATNDNLGLDLIDGVASANLIDMTTDVTEVLLDSITDIGTVLEAFPMLGIGVKAVRAGFSIRDRTFLSKRRLNTDAINLIVQQYLGKQYTSHSLRASFVTIAKLKGIDDSKIMNQTKHKTTAMIRRYTRLDSVRQHNAAQEIGL